MAESPKKVAATEEPAPRWGKETIPSVPIRKGQKFPGDPNTYPDEDSLMRSP